ncbi:hypothetical protein TK11N_10970 [Tetragenococcus koreensis]|uniref:Uncharacterized protein n=1 Tax=Tetragenococcus koreensis TaxID=290335 RepID=A0AAN4ZP10_9ENTE|nr:hypothetical protein TK11N_10970 [Tetragenococcus koreensis]GEQ52323.1 hypothetical protein TK12N_16670 [Tetragenococcus koreensis]GEQ54889.1 hypothetical protein TK2N_17330 [Tetragenococcus koreensis]GEQ57324.1 hypothetical protein TK4N_16670 [Tetragenococcus koreensis]GEQ59258.1 hypothetical protein TK6N_10970 [Tetragenococcus koreensis]
MLLKSFYTIEKTYSCSLNGGGENKKSGPPRIRTNSVKPANNFESFVIANTQKYSY